MKSFLRYLSLIYTGQWPREVDERGGERLDYDRMQSPTFSSRPILPQRTWADRKDSSSTFTLHLLSHGLLSHVSCLMVSCLTFSCLTVSCLTVSCPTSPVSWSHVSCPTSPVSRLLSHGLLSYVSCLTYPVSCITVSCLPSLVSCLQSHVPSSLLLFPEI